eukprot:2552264-Rhodomonas_salina.2
MVEQVNQTLLNLWCGAPTLLTPQLRDEEMGESSPTGEQTQPELDRPFTDSLGNDIWLVFASQMIKGYDKLADIDILEPNLSNRNEAMHNV